MKLRRITYAAAGLIATVGVAWAVDTQTLSLGTNTLVGGIITLYGSTSGSVTVQPAAVAGTATLFQLPATNGSNTNVLTTNGSGVTAWSAAGAGNVSTSGTLTSGKVVIGQGTTTIDVDASAGLVAGALTLGASGTAGSVAMGNATSGTVTITPVAGALGSVTASLPANTGVIAELNLAQSWSAPQRTNTETPTISTATFTPIFSTGQNHRIVLIHASCPCTVANPAAIVAGQSGMFEIVQSSTGSDTIGTWGSEYAYTAGTSAITLSTAANAVDYIPYYVDSTGTTIVLGGIVTKPVH